MPVGSRYTQLFYILKLNQKDALDASDRRTFGPRPRIAALNNLIWLTTYVVTSFLSLLLVEEKIITMVHPVLLLQQRMKSLGGNESVERLLGDLPDP